MMPPPMTAISISSPRSRGEGARRADEGWRPTFAGSDISSTSVLPSSGCRHLLPVNGEKRTLELRQLRPRRQRILDDLFHRLAALARQRLARHAHAVVGLNGKNFGELDVLHQIGRHIEIE